MALKHSANKLQLLAPNAKRHTQAKFTQDNISVRPSNVDKVVKAIYEDLEDISASLGVTQSFTSLTDTPSDYTDVENLITGVNSDGDGIEFKNWGIFGSTLYPNSTDGNIGKSGNTIEKIYFGTSGNLDYQGDLTILNVGVQKAIFKQTSGYLGLGVNNPLEPIHSSNGIVIGNAVQSSPGTIRYFEGDFKGYDGSQWKSFTIFPEEYFNKDVDNSDDIIEGDANLFLTSTERVKLLNISITQPVDLDEVLTDLDERELLANKENSVINTSTTKYPTVNLLKIGLDSRELLSNKENTTLDNSTTKYPTVNLVKTEIDAVNTNIQLKAENYVDISSLISGYTLLSTDAGKVITNSGANVRSLNINAGLALPNNIVFVKGRVSVTPSAGVNIDLPDGTTITNGQQFACLAETQYVLHRKAFSGDDWTLLALGAAKNLGNSDLEITESTRTVEVGAGNRVLKFIQGAQNLVQIRTQSNVPTLEAYAVGTEVALKATRQSGSGSAMTVEGGALNMSSQKIINVADPTNAQDGATKAYVDANGGAILYDDVSVTPLTKRSKYRAVDYIEFVDDALNEETKIQLRADSIKDAEVTRFGENGSGNVDLKIQENKLLVGNASGFAEELIFSTEAILGLDTNNEVKEFEVVEIYNILKEEGITSDKQLALTDINGNSANVKAKFEISAIAVQNTTANAVTFSIGSTALGTDVVNTFALGASETKKLPLGTTFFSITTGQNLFISSGSWNSANINIHVTISKIWQ